MIQYFCKKRYSKPDGMVPESKNEVPKNNKFTSVKGRDGYMWLNPFPHIDAFCTSAADSFLKT